VGVINTTVLDAGLVSTQEEPKKIIAVLVDVTAYQGNYIEGWIGNLRVLEVPDFVFNTRLAAGAANAYASTTKVVRMPIELDVPAGQNFRIGVRSGAVAITLDGAYEYSPMVA
jgi:hypothetical protein